MGLGFPEIQPSGTLTNVSIISETGPWKKEAGLVQEVMAKPDKGRIRRRWWRSEDNILNFFPYLWINSDFGKLYH
jgi:hypothetical protein